MEYEATVRHIKYLEERYGVSVRRLKSEEIEEVCKRVGVPFLSKHISMMIGRLQRKGFKWEDESYEVLRERYKGCESALKWWCDVWSGRFGISYRKGLKEFLMKYPPTFKISEKCMNTGECMKSLREIKVNKKGGINPPKKFNC